jgi:hypothetical protein
MSMKLKDSYVELIENNLGGTLMRVGHDGEYLLVNPHPQSEGYFVAIDQIATLNSLSELRDYQCPRVIVLEPHNYFIGFWYEESTNLWFVDMVIHTNSIEVAQALAFDRGENAFWDIKNNRQVPVNYS